MQPESGTIGVPRQSAAGSVPAAGTELFYWSVGAGPPLIVLGGTALGHSYLRPAMDRLADGHRVIYYDQRGSGRSSLGDADRLSLSGSLADLVSLLDGLDLAQAALLGHSIGGNLAMLFAAAHPDRVSSLVLAMPGPPIATEGMAWETLEGAMTERRSLANDEELATIQQSDAFTNREPAAVEAFIRNIYLPFFSDPSTAAAVRYDLSQHGAAMAVEQEGMLFGDLDTAAALAGLGRIACPTLVLSAELDPIPGSYARSLSDAIPGAIHRQLPGASHFAFLEQPEAFFAAVTDFLAANS